MKFTIALLVLFFSVSTLANCPLYFQSESLCGELKWMRGPLLNEKSYFLFKFWRAEDSERIGVSPNAKIKIYSWMTMASGHDHGGPKMSATEIAPGIFEVRDARFFMHGMNGFWEIVIDLVDNNNTNDSLRYRVKFE